MNLVELANIIGLTPKWVASTAGGEYHSSCPICGGKDRFYIQPYKQMSKCLGAYCCRQCNARGDSIEFAKQFLNCSFVEAAALVQATLPEQNNFKISRTSRLITLVKPPSLWIKKATEFVNQAHENLLTKHKILKYLESRGLPKEAIIRYKLGWSNKNMNMERSSWGLQEELKENGQSRKLWIPQGIVIPSFESSGELVRVKVRRNNWNPVDVLPKYAAISGSMNGLTLIRWTKTNDSILIVVESELDAYAINYALGDLVCVIAVGSSIKNPDNLTDSIARRSKLLLICYDNDKAGIKMLNKWKKLYPHASSCPTPFGKDIGEAINMGLDLRTWLLEIL